MPGTDQAASDLTDDLTLLEDAAREAGRIAMRHFKADPEVWDKGDGAGPVTEADLAVNAMLDSELRAARPGYGWLSEETPDAPDRLGHDRVFIVDPIDGTRSFIEGSRHWGVSLAIVEHGQVRAAAVMMPVKEDLYSARRDGGARKNGAPMTVSPTEGLDQARVLSTKYNFRPEFWQGGPPPVSRHFRSSLAYRLALVGEGTFDGMLTLRPPWEWDIAAGALLVTEAGGRVSLPGGQDPSFNRPDARLPGLLCGNRTVLGKLLEHGPQLLPPPAS